ncbi:uncharacterized protein GLRG_09668 [Colletotrichum graminicola M1.001]|uniref:Uncharacterized protein n=1 Tax=Colletotrichum graminicola (strain M1.001 / M2 / FGSC 10212) TaxID=645133 RepID=E3QUI6_COLGM|nr:uncharacterized protein GLRG_09668 [Colletotrichum graminicola M1.001]EFQ34524.1 hypothetical protein GLRG_09668 [Colletotrichum graminicola M1.001]
MTEPTMLPPLPTLPRPPIPEMVSVVDNWKGKTSPAERRKIQNKLNQRIWMPRSSSRPRHAIIVPVPVLVPVLTDALGRPAYEDAEMQLSQPGPPRKVKEPRVCVLRATLTALEYLGRARPLIELREEDMDDLYDLFLQRAHESRALRGSGSGSGPMADLLLPLVQFNLFRGLMENSKTLGITLSMILDDDCVSPYASDPAYGAGNGWAAVLPSALRPTRTQLTASHHPWLDLLPLPRLRDNLIGAGDALGDDELCLDLIGNGDAPSGRGGMILWGEPWDPRSWEVTEDFVERWRWILEGCGELIVSSNYWRAKRGERRMRVKL